MTQLATSDPQKQCDALVARGSALLAADHPYLDPEMANFISCYLRALSYDVDEAVHSESRERTALLPLMLSELYELVEDTQHRIEHAAGTFLMVKDTRGQDS